MAGSVTHLKSCSMSLTLYIDMSEVAAAGMMMMGVREGRLPPPGGGRAAAAGSSSRRPAVPTDGGPFSKRRNSQYLSN